MSQAAAQDDEVAPSSAEQENPGWESRAANETQPLRVVAGLGAGLSVRLVRNLEFQQERFAPSYIEGFGGVVLPGAGRYRHQATVHVSGNLSGDGNYSFGLDAMEQWTLTPSYTLRIALQDDPVLDYMLYGRFGVPLTVSPDFTWGVQVDAGFAYMFLAGLGIYVEVGYSMFFGAEDRAGDNSIHPLLSGELGVVFDIEIL